MTSERTSRKVRCKRLFADGLAKRVKDLETALADAHIDCSLDRAFLQIACERLGMDIEAFKKKHALTLSDVRKMRGMK